jgi:hypothetical protein
LAENSHVRKCDGRPANAVISKLGRGVNIISSPDSDSTYEVNGGELLVLVARPGQREVWRDSRAYFLVDAVSLVVVLLLDE